jgi:hypothetical protein
VTPSTPTRGATPAQILAVLNQALPGRGFQTAEILSDGWDNLGALVDGRWIFRFPQRPEYRRQVERHYLDALRDASPVPIPRVEFWSEDPAFMGYASLPGVPAPDAWFAAAELAAWVPALAEDLAAFYEALHTRITVPQAQAWGAPRGPGNWATPEKQRAEAERLEEPLRSFALRLFDQAPAPAPDSTTWRAAARPSPGR